jgi:hypothetical protein
MEYETLFIRALIITVLIECLTAAALKRAAAKRLGLSQTYPKFLTMVALASCLTLPYVWFVLPAFLPHGIIYAVSAELFAFVVEAIWYSLALQINIKQAAVLSFAANGLSCLAGLLLF